MVFSTEPPYRASEFPGRESFPYDLNHPRVLLQSYWRRLGIEPEERNLLVLMGALVAVLLGAYTVAKVLRDALFLSAFGAMNLPYAYIAVAFASAGVVWMEGRIVRRFTRVNAVQLSQIIAIAFTILAALLFPVSGKAVSVLFYLWTGSQALMLLPHFWGLALDVWDSRRARHLFPLLTGCGLLGGTLGGALAAWGTTVVHQVGLIWALSILLALAYGLTYWIQRHSPHRATPPETTLPASRWQIFRKSRYIKILAGGLALSVVVSTLVDFQFKTFIAELYPDSNDLTRFLGKFHAGLNALSLLFQFTVAGWLLHRFGLGPSSGLQPLSAGLFGVVTATSSGWWPIVGLRWLQGIVAQGLGKSSAEIYYMALRPHERRIVKPAVDTLVQRWADALVGLMLVVVLHLFQVPVKIIAILTGIMAAVWLVSIVILNRQFGRAFEKALTLRWRETDLLSESLHTPVARRALIKALQSSDEHRILTALELSRYPKDIALARAVVKCLQHSSPSVRRAALDAMRAMRVGARIDTIEAMVEDSHEPVRRGAIEYLLELGPRPVEFARKLLNGNDPVLRQMVLDVLFDRPYITQGSISPEWITNYLQSGVPEDLILAARALGIVRGKVSSTGLSALLSHENPDVRRAALASAARRPHPGFIDLLVPQVLDPVVSFEAREALAAIGNPAVPALVRLLSGENGPLAQVLAARTLALIGTPRALRELTLLVKHPDRRLRHLGLMGLVQLRESSGRPVLSRPLAHRLFLRELGEYRRHGRAAQRLRTAVQPDLRLLGDSFREFAEMALDRAIRALSTWYAPKPLAGALERLKSSEPEAIAPGLEYLGHVLPRSVFKSVTRIFEDEPRKDQDEENPVDEVEASVRFAWEEGDEWLRACAVRASRHAPGIVPSSYFKVRQGDPLVEAELKATLGGTSREIDPATSLGATEGARS